MGKLGNVRWEDEGIIKGKWTPYRRPLASAAGIGLPGWLHVLLDPRLDKPLRGGGCKCILLPGVLGVNGKAECVCVLSLIHI